MFDAYDNKGKFVAQVNERIDKKGNEVMVSSGADMGKQGIVVDVSGQHTTIITRNNHQLRVLTQALTHIYDRVKPDLPIIKLCKYDLVKYQEGVGVVLSWDCSVAKVINQSGKIELISPLLIDEIIRKDSEHLALNKFNQKVYIRSIVRI
jgi:hypothetical protein